MRAGPVNRTFTPNSDFMLSVPAPIQTAKLRQDRNGMMTLPKSAIVARGPSYLAMKRMSWRPYRSQEDKKENKEVEIVGPPIIH